MRLGLEALATHQPDNVLIHDAARPLVDQASITNAIDALAQTTGAIVAIPAGDTIKRVGNSGIPSSETVERSALWRALTPQAFRFADILEGPYRCSQ